MPPSISYRIHSGNFSISIRFRRCTLTTMKPLNFLNRCTIYFLRFALLVAQLCGISIFTYNSQKQKFCTSRILRIYVVLLVLFSIILLLMQIRLTFLLKDVKELLLPINYVALMTRLHILLYSDELVRLLNKMHEVLLQLIVLAKHPNIIRPSHFVLLLLGLAHTFRSFSILFVGGHYISKWTGVLLIWIDYTIFIPYLLHTTINICFFIVLIGSYDVLHQCTRRISNDVRKLRMAQVLHGGQLLVLIEQLSEITAQLIMLRTAMFQITVRVIKLFRFFWLITIGSWLVLLLDMVAFDKVGLYFEALILLNIGFYCTVFEILGRKSKLSRSFWNLHLTNVHSGFDRTIEELLQLEIIEDVRISIYGIVVDMIFLFRIVAVCIFYIIVKSHS